MEEEKNLLGNWLFWLKWRRFLSDNPNRQQGSSWLKLESTFCTKIIMFCWATQLSNWNIHYAYAVKSVYDSFACVMTSQEFRIERFAAKAAKIAFCSLTPHLHTASFCDPMIAQIWGGGRWYTSALFKRALCRTPPTPEHMQEKIVQTTFLLPRGEHQ